jgi:hypothetical protein
MANSLKLPGPETTIQLPGAVWQQYLRLAAISAVALRLVSPARSGDTWRSVPRSRPLAGQRPFVVVRLCSVSPAACRRPWNTWGGLEAAGPVADAVMIRVRGKSGRGRLAGRSAASSRPSPHSRGQGRIAKGAPVSSLGAIWRGGRLVRRVTLSKALRTEPQRRHVPAADRPAPEPFGEGTSIPDQCRFALCPVTSANQAGRVDPHHLSGTGKTPESQERGAGRPFSPCGHSSPQEATQGGRRPVSRRTGSRCASETSLANEAVIGTLTTACSTRQRRDPLAGRHWSHLSPGLVPAVDETRGKVRSPSSSGRSRSPARRSIFGWALAPQPQVEAASARAV